MLVLLTLLRRKKILLSFIVPWKYTIIRNLIILCLCSFSKISHTPLLRASYATAKGQSRWQTQRMMYLGRTTVQSQLIKLHKTDIHKIKTKNHKKHSSLLPSATMRKSLHSTFCHCKNILSIYFQHRPTHCACEKNLLSWQLQVENNDLITKKINTNR